MEFEKNKKNKNKNKNKKNTKNKKHTPIFELSSTALMMCGRELIYIVLFIAHEVTH